MVTGRFAQLIALGLAVLSGACDAKGASNEQAAQEDLCQTFRAGVIRRLDAGEAEMLRRGPDERYYDAIGVVRTEDTHPEATKLAKQAGVWVDPAPERERQIAVANAEFEQNVRRTVGNLRKAAERDLASACRRLPTSPSRCLARSEAVMDQLDNTIESCSDDAACIDRAQRSWQAKNPDCHQLDMWLDRFFEPY